MKASKQTRLKLRKGFHKAPISYRVLMVSQFNKEDQKEIAKGLIAAITPEKANELLPRPGKQSKWSMRQVSLVGNFDVRSLHFKGLEVAAFWRRQTSEVIPDPSDPVPEGVLENPDDVWSRMDLFHKSARQMVGVVGEDLKSLQNENIAKDVYIETLKSELLANDKTIKSLQAQLQAQQPIKAKKRK